MMRMSFVLEGRKRRVETLRAQPAGSKKKEKGDRKQTERKEMD